MADAHDLGGLSGFAAIPHIDKDYEYDERWEWTLMAVLRLGVKKGFYPMDTYRHTVERLPRDFYLGKSYYDRMLTGATRAHIEGGVLSESDIMQQMEVPVSVPVVLPMGTGHAGSAAPQTVRFQPGDRVRVRADLPAGHVRAPAYVLGHSGTIIDRGRHALAFPGRAGHREAAVAEFTYRVEFDRRTLWSDAPDAGTVTVDLSDSYLEPRE